MKKKIISGVILVFVLVAFVFVFQNKKAGIKTRSQNNSTQSQGKNNDYKQQIVGDTSGWKTFENQGWGYKLQYPANLYVKINTQGDKFPGDTSSDVKLSNGKISSQEGGQTMVMSDKEKMGIQDVMPDEKIHIIIDTFKLDSNYYKGQTWRQHFDDPKNGLTKNKINGFDAYYIGPKLGNDSGVSFGVFIIKDDWVYNLSGMNFVDKEIDSENMKLMEKIISTFEFIK